MTNPKPQLKDHHHYKGGDLNRAEQVERTVVEMILESKLHGTKNESSKVWELKHSSGCCQIARILAQKRGLNVELAETSAVLHDIYVAKTGKYKDHARLSVPIAQKILQETGGFSEEEIKIILDSVACHSEKEIYTNDPYIELMKDVDVFDCSLYKNAVGYYRLHKPESVFKQYVERIKRVRAELGLSKENVLCV